MKMASQYFDIDNNRWLITAEALEQYRKVMATGHQPDAAAEKTDLKKLFEHHAGTISQALRNTNTDEKRIGYLKMIGPMLTYGNWYAYGSDEYVQWLRQLNEDSTVSAIVVDIDGPGGAVAAINAFKDFASEKSKPVVVLANQLCSLHYWFAALLADHVMANGTISPCIGSIGVTNIIMDSREAMAKDGFKVLMINAPGSDMKNQAMRDFYEGKDKEFIERIQAEMVPVREAFVNDVRDARPDINKEVFKADTYNANKALDMGLIDSIGNIKQAFSLAEALAEL